jgi:mono/diheme cytochrome c family protein
MTRRAATVVGIAVALGVVLSPSAAAQEPGEAQRGREVFEQNCAMCHGSDASGMMGMHPSLRGAVERLSAEGVEVTIRKGRDVMPPMPAFEDRLSRDEIQDVIAYLDTLPVGPRNFGGEDQMMDMDGMMGGGMWSWVAWMALFLVVVAAIIAGSVLVARSLWRRGGSRQNRRGEALAILEQRYARGEIDRDEFDERRRAIASE